MLNVLSVWNTLLYVVVLDYIWSYMVLHVCTLLCVAVLGCVIKPKNNFQILHIVFVVPLGTQQTKNINWKNCNGAEKLVKTCPKSPITAKWPNVDSFFYISQPHCTFFNFCFFSVLRVICAVILSHSLSRNSLETKPVIWFVEQARVLVNLWVNYLNM